MEKKLNIRGTQAVSRCNKKRTMSEVKISDITLESFKRTKITRGAISLWKNEGATMEDVNSFIDKSFDALSFPHEKVKDLQKAEVSVLVHKYLDADGRRSSLNSKIRRFTFRFGGETVYYKPDFLFEYTEEVGRKTVPVVEVVSMTTGEQKFLTSKRYGAGKETTSLHHNLDGLGMILFGKTVLGGREGIVRCVFDALKTTEDKAGDYSREWSVAKTDDSGTKSGDNRVWTEVRFSSRGQVISGRYYEIGDSRRSNNTRWDNRELFKGYKETLEHYVGGKPSCTSKEECRKNCEFFEICNYNHIPATEQDKVVEDRKAVEPTLNPQQQEVANFREGIACVDAGPGSGKTQVMAFRIAKMLLEGAKPSDFLVISFSKAAVKTITDRVSYFVNDVYGMGVDVAKIKTATFNSLGDALLTKYFKELGYTEAPELADGVEIFNLVMKAVDFENQVEGFDYKNYKMPSIGKNFAGGVVAEMTKAISEIRSNGMSKEEFLDKTEYTPEQAEEIWRTNERFSALMVENNLKDYSDQQYQVVRLLSEINPEAVTETYRFKHVIVDEFQDSNDFQMLFISELINTSKFESLMVVGDDAQAIYLFRGTSPENIINFEEKLGAGLPVEEYLLTENYRSAAEIVDLSNEVLEHNSTKIKKVLTSDRGKSGQLPTFKSFEKSKDEVNYICDGIENLLKGGCDPRDVAVIAATRSSLKAVSKELSARTLVSQFDMGERLLDNLRVRAFIGFCSFATSPDATKGLLEYMNEMYNGRIFDLFTPEKVNSLLEKAKEDFLNSYVLLNMEDKKDYILRCLNALEDGTDAVFTSFREKIEAKKRLDAFSLLSYVRDFYELDMGDTAEKGGSLSAVNLVTAHSSKGKEWKHVFVTLSDFDKVPTRNLEEKEEKRRLIFVAFSRARDTLTVSTLREKEREGDMKPRNPWYVEMKTYKSFRNLD